MRRIMKRKVPLKGINGPMLQPCYPYCKPLTDKADFRLP